MMETPSRQHLKTASETLAQVPIGWVTPPILATAGGGLAKTDTKRHKLMAVSHKFWNIGHFFTNCGIFK